MVGLLNNFLLVCKLASSSLPQTLLPLSKYSALTLSLHMVPDFTADCSPDFCAMDRYVWIPLSVIVDEVNKDIWYFHF